jgi:hypothetical protein
MWQDARLLYQNVDRSLQVAAIVGDVQHSSGRHADAIASYRQSLSILKDLGQDQGSVAATIQKRLLQALLDRGRPEQALAVICDMLPYAANVHIQEHSTAMHCLEKVVSALVETGSAWKAIDAADTLYKVRHCTVPLPHACTHKSVSKAQARGCMIPYRCKAAGEGLHAKINRMLGKAVH